MAWKIKYYNEALQGEILDFPETLLARYIRLTSLMTAHGTESECRIQKPSGTGYLN